MEQSGFWQRETEESFRVTNGITGPENQLQQLVAGLGGTARAEAKRQGAPRGEPGSKSIFNEKQRQKPRPDGAISKGLGQGVTWSDMCF